MDARSRRKIRFTEKFKILFKNYKFKSIFFRYLRYILITYVVLVVVALAAIYILGINSQQREKEAEIQSRLVSIANNWDLVFRYVETYHSSLLQSSHITLTLGLHEESAADALYDTLWEESAKNAFFQSIHVYRLTDGAIFSSSPQSSTDETLQNQEYTLDHYDKAWLSAANEHRTVMLPRLIEETNQLVISIIKPIHIGSQHVGYVCYNLRNFYFSQTTKEVMAARGTDAIWLVDAKDEVLFYSDTAPFKSYLRKRIVEADCADDTDRQSVPNLFSARTDATILTQPLSYNSMKLIYSLDHRDFFSVPPYILQFILIAFPVALVLCALVAARLASTMYDHIFRILNFFNSSTIESVEAPPSEISDILNKIGSVLSKNADIEIEYAQKLIELKKAQTIALQTQINPHFVLNTLQLVSLLQIREHGVDTDSSVILNLMADLFRNNLRTDEYTISIAEEIRFAKKYLQIEAYRNYNNFSVTWDVDPTVYNQIILRFTLQPILENCILHGFADSDQPDKHIDISIKRIDHEGEWIVLAVKDNGIGMDPERLDKMRDLLEEPFIPENRKIGIANVNMRLKLIFGAEAKMTIASEVEKGTIVTLKIPM